MAHSGDSGRSEREQVPIREGFLTTPLWPLDQVRLVGTRCRSCGETFFGKRYACENCQSQEVEDIALSRRGKLYSYTVQRYRPPGDYKGPDDPYIPFVVGLVELPEGLRIIAPVSDCDVDRIQVGTEVELVVETLYQDESGNDVMAYKFRPVRG